MNPVHASASLPSAAARSIVTPVFDRLFILAPLWVGCLYLTAVYALPSARPFVFFLFLAVLGETHFGATGLFLLMRGNRAWLWRRRRLLLYVPAGLVTACLFIGMWKLSLALLIGGIASGIHVTRQSIGISRLYGGPRRGLNEPLIYCASVGFLGIGFARFSVPILPFPPSILGAVATAVPWASAALLVLIALGLLLIGSRSGYDRRWLAALTGCVIYFPYCFVSAPQDAIAVGVGMHWCQYLGLNAAVYGRQAVASGTQNRLLAATGLIAVYGLVMASIHTAAGTVLDSANLFVVLPLCGEIIHYYLDAFIWRFSDPQIRTTIGAYLWRR
jgi:hypothetical protein